MRALDKHQFRPIAVEIEETPLPVWEWLTLSTIVLTICLAVGFLTMGQVDIVVSAHGKVVPQGQVLVIQPLETGVVKEILAKPGDFVHKGQVLMEIEPELVQPELVSAKNELDVLQLKRARIISSVSDAPFNPLASACSARQVQLEKSIYESESASLAQQLNTKEAEREQIKKQIEAANHAYDEANKLLKLAEAKWSKLDQVETLLSNKDLDPVKEEIVRYQSDMNKTNSQLAELNHKLAQIDSQKAEIRKDFSRRLLKELDETKNQEIELNAKVRQHSFRNQLQRITAPTDGTINERFLNTVGGVVSPAEKLMTLVPKDKPLEIEALALNRDVGFIRPGMRASVKIDTFDYQKYGLIEGSVTKVASDSIKDDELGQVFVVTIKPDKTVLRVDGRDATINPGMTVESEIKVGKRRMIEFFLNPVIKSWQHSVSLK
jgi:hemolysin D